LKRCSIEVVSLIVIPSEAKNPATSMAEYFVLDMNAHSPLNDVELRPAIEVAGCFASLNMTGMALAASTLQLS